MKNELKRRGTGRWLASFTALFATAAFAQQIPVGVAAPAPAEPNAIALYPDSAPGKSTEQWEIFFGKDYAVRNVTRPTLTPFLPDPKRANGAAVIVAPGGGFMLLAMSLEGWSVAQALADHGITAFVLKYRLNETPADEKEFSEYAPARMMKDMRALNAGERPSLKEPRATDDAIAALKYVRANAKRWGIDPARVGIMGFSAGAMTALNVALTPNAERPAFIAPIYPPMFSVEVPADAPPMFCAIAADDPLFAGHGFGLIESWANAHRPVELHLYESGSHGFGLGRAGTTTMLMLDEFLAWLEVRGVVPHQEAGRKP